jgi:hypothetical protein
MYPAKSATRRLTLRALAAKALCISVVGLAAAPVVASPAATPTAGPVGQVRPVLVGGNSGSTIKNPSVDREPVPDYINFCATHNPNNARCISQELQAINRARSHESMRKVRMILPDNYTSLSIAQQTFVVTDLERVDRGLRPFVGLTPRLNWSAQHAAIIQNDPLLSGLAMQLMGIREYGSIWAGDFGPLASDYDWMYNDGYSPSGSINLDCRTPNQSGCWGHRENILGAFSGLSTLIAGAGSSGAAGRSIAEVLAGTQTHAPRLTYTWKQALAHGANGHKVTAH